MPSPKGNDAPERKFLALMKEKPAEKDGQKDLWDEIGFHKPLAGFWYNLLYTLIGIVISAGLMGILMNTFYPFPESWGYREIITSMFTLFFVIFDLGTANVMDRFLGEENIKDPAKMIKLIQWFIWYQMMTGLIQITGVSIYALYLAPHGNQSYGIWLMIIVGSTQYPGFLGVFRNALGSLQHYGKVQMLNFFTGTLFQRLTEIAFVILFRILGEMNPAIGPLLGIAIGSAIGLYVDDFFATVVSAHFFSKVMRVYGIRARDCLIPSFTWADIKPVLKFALKTGVPGLVWPAFNLLNLVMWLTFVPHYSTFIILAGIGGSIPSSMDWFGVPGITPLVSESYLNEKPRLTQYYAGQYLRFQAFLKGFFVALMLAIFPVMPLFWAEFMPYYVLATTFMLPQLVVLVFNAFTGVPGQILFGADRPNFAVVMGMIGTVGGSGVLFLLIGVFNIPGQFGVEGFAWVYFCGGLPLNFVLAAASYRFVDRRIVRIKVPWGQVGSMAIASVVTFALCFLVKLLVFDTLYPLVGFIVAAIPSIVFMFLVLLFGYFPLTALLGGWDDVNLAEFRKAVVMAGPSKILVAPVYLIVEWACRRSKYHGRFAMDVGGVIQDAIELLEIKRVKREQMREDLAAL